ncbi:hypothetical protein [Marinagarivorans cellulosilyticus]|uniref:hypothetical protein n=1 Tax=Marinagarivorans cellulosilyticus TaxID=2721545 RepID=UPI001F42C226|nr:hypothetical protein [Marinagarivorans cellulosilyticus]
MRARKHRQESRSLRGVNEDSRTELTPLSRKKCIFRDALKRLSQANGKSDVLKRGRDQDLYFETPSLIAKKAQLIQQGDYAGAMVFELTGDSLDPQTSLLRRVHQRLQAVGCQS